MSPRRGRPSNDPPPLKNGQVVEQSALLFLKAALRVFGEIKVEDRVLRELESRTTYGAVMAYCLAGQVWVLRFAEVASREQLGEVPDKVRPVRDLDQLAALREQTEAIMKRIDRMLAGIDEPNIAELNKALEAVKGTITPSRMGGIEVDGLD